MTTVQVPLVTVEPEMVAAGRVTPERLTAPVLGLPELPDEKVPPQLLVGDPTIVMPMGSVSLNATPVRMPGLGDTLGLVRLGLDNVTVRVELVPDAIILGEKDLVTVGTAGTAQPVTWTSSNSRTAPAFDVPKKFIRK